MWYHTCLQPWFEWKWKWAKVWLILINKVFVLCAGWWANIVLSVNNFQIKQKHHNKLKSSNKKDIEFRLSDNRTLFGWIFFELGVKYYILDEQLYVYKCTCTVKHTYMPTHYNFSYKIIFEEINFIISLVFAFQYSIQSL